MSTGLTWLDRLTDKMSGMFQKESHVSSGMVSRFSQIKSRSLTVKLAWLLGEYILLKTFQNRSEFLKFEENSGPIKLWTFQMLVKSKRKK